MLRLKFALRGRISKTTGLDRIRATYYFEGKRCRFDTDFFCHPKDWNKRERVIKAEAKKSPSHTTTNVALREARSKAEKAASKALEERRAITKLEVNDILASLTPLKHRIESEVTLKAFFESYPKSAGFAPKTLEKYKTVSRQLFEINSELDWNGVTTLLYETWVKQMKGKGLRESAWGKNVATLKSIMHAGAQRRLHNTTDYKAFEAPKVSSNPRKKIWLRPSQVQTLINAELTDPTLSYARDYFICGIKSGQRYGDWIKVLSSKETATAAGTPVVKFKQEKTKKEITVRICDTLRHIRERWNEGLIPEVISYNTVRKHLKRLGDHLGLPHLTTHVARRSFGRQSWEDGIPMSKIQVAFGHATMKQTAVYLDLDSELVRDLVADTYAEIEKTKR